MLPTCYAVRNAWSDERDSAMVALMMVAVALALNNFRTSIAMGVSGVNRRTEWPV
jgi:hypothetical protein